MALFLDANIPIYAAGQPSEFKQPCADLLAAAAGGTIDACTDVGVLQEIAYRYHGRDRIAYGVAIARNFAISLGEVLPLGASDGLLMLQLLLQFKSVPPFDLLHYAVMLRHGITHIITADAHFDALPGITRIDPRDSGTIVS